ncbi:MAB_1171c family putative transporter [Streptomyces sp. NPDC048442]|uniref:MAB_1171c family putative transporter n=1 Tax=Streptomyces sp. NPDC048442 TaxID=3154823 RepID=UPI003449A9A5
MLYRTLEWVCMLAAAVAFCYSLPALIRRPTSATVALSLYYLSSALSYLAGLEPFVPYLATVLGSSSTVYLAAAGLMISLTVAQQVVLSHWSHPPAAARRHSRRLLLAYGALLAGLLLLLPSGTNPATVPTSKEGQGAFTLLLVGCYFLGCGVGQWETVRLSLRYANLAERPWLRRGMWTVVAGAVLVLTYCALRLIEVIGVSMSFSVGRWDTLRWLSGDIGSFLEIVGWTVPAWGPRLSAARRWASAYRQYRRLRPLWEALYRATPDIALDPPGRLAQRMPPRDLELGLYRRVIEIQDGWMALRPYTCPAVAAAARRNLEGRRLPAGRRRAMEEALILRATLRAKDAGAAPPFGPRSGCAPPAPAGRHEESGHHEEPGRHGEEEHCGETAWLVAVAEAFAALKPASPRTSRDAASRPGTGPPAASDSTVRQ